MTLSNFLRAYLLWLEIESSIAQSSYSHTLVTMCTKSVYAREEIHLNRPKLHVPETQYYLSTECYCIYLCLHREWIPVDVRSKL